MNGVGVGNRDRRLDGSMEPRKKTRQTINCPASCIVTLSTPETTCWVSASKASPVDPRHPRHCLARRCRTGLVSPAVARRLRTPEDPAPFTAGYTATPTCRPSRRSSCLFARAARGTRAEVTTISSRGHESRSWQTVGSSHYFSGQGETGRERRNSRSELDKVPK